MNPGYPKADDNGWITLDTDSIFFLSLLTHEVRSTLSSKTLLPVTRINDNKMIVYLMEKTNKLRIMPYIPKFLFNRHLYMKGTKVFDAEVIKITSPNEMNISADGELYKTNGFESKVLPGYVNFIGKVHEFSQREMQLKNEFYIL